MDTGDERMGLTTAKSGLHTLDRRGAHVAGDAAEDTGYCLLQAVRRVCPFFKEDMGIGIDLVNGTAFPFVVLDDGAQCCREDFRVERALYDARARCACFKYCFQR